MAFWERNTIVFALASLAGGILYFSVVATQSIAAGALVAPNLLLWLGYISLQITISVVGAIMVHRQMKAAQEVLPKEGEDERDRLIRMKAEGMQGHVMSAFIFLAMAAWFVHANSAIFFHSLVAALILSELARAGWQLFSYNRAY